MIRKITLSAVIIVSGVLAVLNVMLFGGKHYSAAVLMVAILACIPFYFSFERKNSGGSKEIMMTSIMIALSVCGRIIFSFIPFFKPVTAITVIGGMYFGCTPGFVIGSFSALISNIYFGQGPWTIFQMFSWGIIGCIAGLLGKRLENKVFLVIFGALSGMLFSIIMDIWTVLNIEGTFVFKRYLAQLVSGLPITLTYTISNVIFLLLLQKPFGKKLRRAKIKYGIFKNKI